MLKAKKIYIYRLKYQYFLGKRSVPMKSLHSIFPRTVLAEYEHNY